MLLLLGLLVIGGIAVTRRRPIVVHDGTLDRKTTYFLVGALVVLSMLTGLNSLPSELGSYDTAQPWSTFIGSTAVGFVMAIPLTLIAFGLWLVLGALRRRVGIPMLAGEPSRSASTDMLSAGMGLGGIIYAMTHLDALVPRSGMPRTPTTMLNEVVPLFAGIAGIPMSALATVAMAGIPLLVVAGLTSRWSLRALIAGAGAVLVAVLAWSFEPASDLDPVTVTLVIAGLAVVSIALVVWGALSAWSWIVAALFVQALNGLREAAYGPVWQARGAGALTVLVACALIAIIAQRTARTRQAS
ncbi:MAG TPA: hypothetical protein VFH13_06585, partial [Gemmatimonadaceae bacterium]|nr:hypothetical protein [Gemmatimonadaceae bacterium]